MLDKELSKSAKIKKERVAAVEEKRAKQAPNPAQNVPSQQPSGAQVEGPHRAVQATLVMPYLQIQLRLPTIHEKTANLFH